MCAVGINGFSAGRHRGAVWVTVVITLLTITNPLESSITFYEDETMQQAHLMK